MNDTKQNIDWSVKFFDQLKKYNISENEANALWHYAKEYLHLSKTENIISYEPGITFGEYRKNIIESLSKEEIFDLLDDKLSDNAYAWIQKYNTISFLIGDLENGHKGMILKMATEYSKDKYKDEYAEPDMNPDVQNSNTSFTAGFNKCLSYIKLILNK